MVGFGRRRRRVRGIREEERSGWISRMYRNRGGGFNHLTGGMVMKCMCVFGLLLAFFFIIIVQFNDFFGTIWSNFVFVLAKY